MGRDILLQIAGTPQEERPHRDQTVAHPTRKPFGGHKQLEGLLCQINHGDVKPKARPVGPAPRSLLLGTMLNSSQFC